ncbi:class A beta-lactamase [Burkholderia gladioli]|uniref:class A beta-lactamase n=1 Tax=Burkholderia gladioli TaxID=28095 RepID=UPI00164155C3|nr:class A beta-lactamase [Burkholderia gladioli]
MHWLSAVLRAAAGSIICAVLAAPPACAGTPAATGTARAGDARHDALQATLERFAQAARPGTLGVVVLDLERPARWQVNGTLPFPMMSVFKAPLGATVLDLAEQGRLPLGQRITITRDQLRGGHSPIRETFQGQQMSFTVDTLLRAAVSDSDNTAADALLRAVGGPAVVTGWLRAHGIEGMRVDMDEGEVSRIFGNLGASPAPPPAESPQQRSRRLQGGLDAYLADPRNRTTPLAAAEFLRKLAGGELLPPTATRRLLGLLRDQTQPRRLRAGLPPGVTFADKCGTSLTVNGTTAAFNDIGILTWPDGHRLVIAAFLSASRASRAERERLFADLARAVASAAVR